MDRVIKKFPFVDGRIFHQLLWDGNVNSFKNFLKIIDEDLLLQGWGYDPGDSMIRTPNGERAFATQEKYIYVIEQETDIKKRYQVNSMDLSEIFKKR